MQPQEITMNLISGDTATNNEAAAAEGHTNSQNENPNLRPNNINNNQLGEYSQSTNPIDKKKRPSILINFAFLLAIIDVVLAGVCSG